MSKKPKPNMEEDKKILKKICEKNGVGKATAIGIFDSLLLKYGDIIANDWLRGVLLSVDTLKKIFGEEETCLDCGDIFKKVNHPEYGEMFNCDCGLQKQVFPVEAFEYHAIQLVLLPTSHEILKYISKYL